MKKPLKKTFKWTTGLLLAAFAVSACNSGVLQDTENESSPSSQTVAWNQYQPPNRGAPGRTQDAGSRPLCPKVEKPFTALSPSTNWGETLEAHPTVWLYIPENTHSVRLILRDEPTQTEIYRTTFPLTAQKGIGRFSLPAEAPPLDPNRLYNWQFDLICDAENSSRFRVSGIVVRREPSEALKTQLQAALPPARVNLLAAEGLWFDAVTALAQQRLASPQESTLQTGWESLLHHADVGLNQFSGEDVLECCEAISED
ncbi:MAG: DUF928 domain-containing protein [Cyanobacteria bacterium J06634_5]